LQHALVLCQAENGLLDKDIVPFDVGQPGIVLRSDFLDVHRS